jgi:DNA-binding winged helix-turn-helix (wHTH) protein/tetratricopeptide (TPR) repeat protein
VDTRTRHSVAVELALEPDFRVGPVAVSPSTRQLRHGANSLTLEPRVMQLLVVLAHANGHVVSRDELIHRCWDGVVVGENAINRVVSLLRAAAAEHCAGAFRIETIKKVGYRLVAEPSAVRATASDVPSADATLPANDASATRDASTVGPAPLTSDVPAAGDLPRTSEAPARLPALSRRTLLIGGATLGAVAIGAGIGWLRAKKGPSPLARELYARGSNAQRQGLLDQTEQAIAFFREAVEVDPEYAAAWGALALSYRHKMVDDPTSNAQALADLLAGAARRALTLDPDNADAHVARVLAQPTFRHWSEQEQVFRRTLGRFPGHWLMRGSLGRLLYDVGRWSAGVPLFRANVEADAFLPVSRIALAEGLWALGRPHEAEQVYREALDRWPTHYRVWLTTFNFLALSGRPDEALALGGERQSAWPPGLPRPLVERNVAWARALETGRAELKAESAAALTSLATEYPATIPSSAPVLAALGAGDSAIALAGDYFDAARGTRPGENPLRRADWRETSFLFCPPLAPVRGDPRFAEITASIGLDDYWKRTGTAPDRPI